MLATYAGAKAFLATWSQALGEELRSTGVLVQHVNTFWVVCLHFQFLGLHSC
jgi:17beta-estradiol 17-dehydrogenase / very-long-chain 3-oxoacyl-CoA reductase